jgi:hypothetical protein
MVMKIYEVANLSEIKKVLEADDHYEVKASCAKCGDKIDGKLSISEISLYEPTEARGKIKPPVKNSKCGQPFKFEKKEFLANQFKMQGYKLQDAASLGISKAVNYLCVDATEDFFKKNEKTLLAAGAKALKNKEYEEIKKKFESAEAGAVESMGAIFG